MSKPNDALLPCRVDDITESDPLRIYAEIPTSDSSYDLGFTPITYKQLANAINGAAWWLEDTVGVGHNFETLAYSGSNNLRYPIIVLGAVKAGYKVKMDWVFVQLLPGRLTDFARFFSSHLETASRPSLIYSSFSSVAI